MSLNKENMELWNMKMHHQLMEDADALGDEWDDSSEDETMETENSEENVGEEEEVLLDDIGSGEESGSGSDSEDSFSFLEEEEVLTDRSDDSLVEFDYGEELADPPASAKGFDEVDNVQLEGRVNNVLRDYVFIDSDNDTSHQHENGMAPVNRRVTFNLTPTVHTMVVWDYAYRAARKGKWEEAARDNARFSRRIDSLRPELEAILRMDHRQRIYEERFGAPADDSTIEKSI
ncbi:Protein phosphatase 1 regulatory subunit 15A [Pseudolycoriella hygida]|uniref:Protein DP71L n=1 Tax=Pseudolycoriella hygida TaxID=35572 RepID=A0A9Q0N6E3_9DIPT|nr:Protein phosphatase 1 regulatory subunit 15A [Pseudolycoriella hygida]